MLRNISELQTQTPGGEPTDSYTHTYVTVGSSYQYIITVTVA